MKSYAQQGSNAQILQQCREALVELSSLREREAILKKQIEEYKRLDSLKDDQIALLEKSVAEYEKVVAAIEKVEIIVAELRKNHAAQMTNMEKQLANEKRKVFLWKVVAGIAAVLALLTGTRK